MKPGSLSDVPYARALGIEPMDQGLVLRFSEGLIGAPGRLHGGALAGLLELTAMRAVGEAAPEGTLLKPINVTVDYLREGRLQDTYASATLEKLGRRVAHVRVTAWQDDRARPVASARLNILLDRA